MTENRDRPEWLVPIFSYLEASSKQPQTGLALLNRSRSSIPVGPRHGDPFHRYLRAIPAWRIGLLSALWHGNPAHRCLSSILAWQSVLLTGPRHGDPFHRYLGGILAWRRGLLSTLWHGDPQPKQFWGRVVCRRKGNRYRCRDYGRVHDRVRHGDPTRMHFRAIPAGRTASRPVHDQSLTDLLPITNRC